MTLRELREVMGMTQQRLEAESGVKQQTISEIEQRDSDEIGRISYETVQRLVTAFQRAGCKGLKAEHLFPIVSAERAS